MSSIEQLSPGTWGISLPFLGEPGIIGSYLLAGENELVVIDPGPESMIEHLLAAMREVGFAPEQVTHILATHIHLDHAGAAGSLTRIMPNAQVYAHTLGAPHLLDTSKVVASASRIYGERMQMLWGNIEPVPAGRLTVIEEGDALEVAGRRLQVYYTPGHAIHHVVFFDPRSREIFVGDVAGVRLQDSKYIRPPTPPPDIDLEAWSASMDKVMSLQPAVLYLAHFGPTRAVEEHFSSLRQRLFTWGEFVLQQMRAGKSESEIIAAFMEYTEPELQRATTHPHALQRYEIASSYAMTVQGYMRYWRKKHPERLA